MGVGKRNELMSLQVGRGIAALFVVGFHTSAIFSLPKYWHAYPFLTIFQPGNSGVYYFFVLSGFIIAYAHESDIGRPHRLFRYVRNRIRRIYPMYWLVSAAALVASILLFHQRFETLFLVGSFTLIPVEGDRGNLAVAWTLFHEMIFYVLFACLILSRKWGSAILATWAAGCLLGVFVVPRAAFLSTLFAPINLLFFVGLGAFVIIRRYRLPQAWAVGGSGAIIYAAIWIYQAVRPDDQTGASLIFAYGMACGLIVLAFADLDLQGRLSAPKSFRLLGDASYSIYLTHFLLLSLLAKIFFRGRAFMPESVAFLSMAILATLAGVGIHLCIEKPITRALRRLSGPASA
jgi:peptidoglycan/LPS O-acetylase OafA/YrhL